MLCALCRPALQQEAFVAPATARQIADELVVTEAAVKQHLLRLYGKFRIAEGADRRARLANEVLSAGVVRPVPPTSDGERRRLTGACCGSTARSAASTALRNSIATVVGPTPPSRGRDRAGHLGAGLVDVGQQPLALVAHAAADDGRPGADVLGLRMPGTPAAATTTAARRV